MKIVEKLQSHEVKLVFVVDEGLAVLDGVIQGVKRPVALYVILGYINICRNIFMPICLGKNMPLQEI